MIPLRLVIHNFRAIEHADIDLSAVSLAAIAGRNGAGKSSAFTLAPRFALFGDVISGVSLDDLVRRGATEMSVEFWFEHQSSVYRTIRTRSTKGKGKSTLELQKCISSQWESRSAEKIVDTEAVIRDLLNLDDETFTASSMILQGQANAFTGATAGKRKEILTQILGLSIYEQLQERARMKAGTLNLEIEKAKDKLAELSERLLLKPEKVTALEQTERELKKTREQIALKEAELQQQDELIHALKLKSEKADELARQIETLRDEVVNLNDEKINLAKKLERVSKILANETDILAKSAEYQQVKEQIVSLEARRPEERRLLAEIQNIDASIDKIQRELLPIEHRTGNLLQLLQNRDLLEAKSAEYIKAADELRVMEKIAEQWDELEKQIVNARAAHSKEDMRIEILTNQLQQEIKNLTAKTAMLADTNCIDVTIAACRFLSDAQEAKSQLTAKKSELARIDVSLLGDLGQKVVMLEESQRALGYDHAAFRLLKARVDELRPLDEQCRNLQSTEDLLQSLQDQVSQLYEQKTGLEAKRESTRLELDDLGHALLPLESLRERAGKLEAWAKLKDELAAAQEAKHNVDERIAAIDQEIELKSSKLSALKVERSMLLLDVLGLNDACLIVKTIKGLILHLREKETDYVGQIGGLKADLSTLEKDEQERIRLAAEMEPNAKRWARYQTLIKAFGRDGIPALIIENAVPQLERIANEILGQMSKGKHYVRFETQRELKSRAGVSETLDIMIGDWSSERPYETFSGGEQLRIDYAIRFALAELLAQRAGSKVEWLCIDEGLGSQDAEHRQLVLDAIKSVADRFKKVLVITHIEDAQLAFEQVIRFDNTDGGVEVQVA